MSKKRPKHKLSLKGKKFDKGKPELALLPYEALEEVSKVLMFGASKYGRDNWKSKIAYSRLISAALRHIHKFNNKQTLDEESGINHIAHAICNLMFILYFEKYNSVECDDR